MWSEIWDSEICDLRDQKIGSWDSCCELGIKDFFDLVFVKTLRKLFCFRNSKLFFLDSTEVKWVKMHKCWWIEPNFCPIFYDMMWNRAALIIKVQKIRTASMTKVCKFFCTLVNFKIFWSVKKIKQKTPLKIKALSEV